MVFLIDNVRIIIETYAMDMQLLEEQKKLNLNGYLTKLIEKGDETTNQLYQETPSPLITDRVEKMLLICGVQSFAESPAAFVHKKILTVEKQRQKLWENIHIKPTHQHGFTQAAFEERSSTWRLFWRLYRKDPETTMALLSFYKAVN